MGKKKNTFFGMCFSFWYKLLRSFRCGRELNVQEPLTGFFHTIFPSDVDSHYIYIRLNDTAEYPYRILRFFMKWEAALFVKKLDSPAGDDF